MDARNNFLLVTIVVLLLIQLAWTLDSTKLLKPKEKKIALKVANATKRNFIADCCGKFMCPNMTVAVSEDQIVDNRRKPPVVVVVMNKPPPPGFLDKFFTAATNFFVTKKEATTASMSPSTSPVTTTAEKIVTEEETTTSSQIPTTTPTTTTTSTSTSTSKAPASSEKETTAEVQATSTTTVENMSTLPPFNPDHLYKTCTPDKKWSNAAADCCRRGMTLLAIETDEEFTCLSKTIFNRKPGNYWNEGSGSYWTAGSDLAEEGKFKWYLPGGSEDLKISSMLRFTSQNPDNMNGSENCLELFMNDPKVPAINDNNCELKKKYICETNLKNPVPFPICPDKSKCVVDPKKKAEVDKIIAKMEDDGSDSYELSGGPLFVEACDKFYMLRFEEHTYESAVTECCKYGFKSVTIDSPEEMKCLFDQKDEIDNGQFWTSGSSQGPLSEDNHHWCDSGKPVNKSLWDPSQPHLPWDERCVAIHYRKDLSALHDFPCSHKLYLFCEKA